ncbi:MAG: purine-nucleoside phosphorylase [Clostridia bacterium]|nr:purine-nucleoside phosphorylase [Clostridia bacterium]
MVKIDKIIKKIKKVIGDFRPEIGLILGSGLSDACPDIKIYKEITYADVGLPVSIVKGHIDSFIFGEYKGIKIIKLSRFHYYESGDMDKVSLPFAILKALEVKDLILATATGGVSKDVNVGDIVLIKDHVNLAPNPLIGKRDQYFLSMFDAYDSVYRNVVKEISLEEKIDLKEGIHIQVTGPSYETPAEIERLEKFGDTVSMSLAVDVVLSRFYDIKVLCFGVVCNKAGTKGTHEGVLSKSKTASKNLKILITKFIDNKFNIRKV